MTVDRETASRIGMAAETIREAVHRLALMAEPGYGGNICALVELLNGEKLAELERARVDLAAMQADRDAALIHLPVCCGSLADAASTLKQEREDAEAQRDRAESELDAERKMRVEAEAAATRAEARLAALTKATQSTIDAIWPPIEELRGAKDWSGIFAKARDEIRAAIGRVATS